MVDSAGRHHRLCVIVTLLACGPLSLRAETASEANPLHEQVRELLRDPTPDRDTADYMTGLAERREKAIALIDRLLKQDPKTKHRDELLLAKLESMYLVAIVRAQRFDALRAEAKRVRTLKPSQPLADYAAYLEMQIEIAEHRRALRRRSLATQPTSAPGRERPSSVRPLAISDVVGAQERFEAERYRAYVAQHPRSRFTPMLLANLIDRAWDRDDATAAASYLAQLRRDHPNNVETHRILAAQRLRNAIGKSFALQLKDLDGGLIDLEAMKGNVVLVVFWATWSPKCRVEVPRVNALQQRLRPRGLKAIGVSLDESRPALIEFMARQSMDWPQHIEPKQWDADLVKRFGVRSLPTVFVVDKAGKLCAVSPDDLASLVERLVEEVEAQ